MSKFIFLMKLSLMKLSLCIFATSLLALPLVAFTLEAFSRDRIQIVGSSTVFPFATAVAETFGQFSSFPTPVVESTGSGGGIKLFCSGVGSTTPDITNASRRIKSKELETCQNNGVTSIEVKIGYDGIVLGSVKGGVELSITREHIFNALAKQVVIDGELVDNPHEQWSDVDSSLPAIKIEVLGPPPTSGTRDAFVELAMEYGAKQSPLLADLSKSDKSAFKRIAHSVREDGVYVEAGENDNLIVQKLKANKNAIGIFGFSFLDQNSDQLQSAIVEGREAEFEYIADGSYPISRSLFFYVKKEHIGEIPGLREYIAEFVNPDTWGDEGYLIDKGLIPLTDSERSVISEQALGLTALESVN